MKFHHINHALTEAEDDPFADPTPTDLKVYLAKLKIQLLRAYSDKRIVNRSMWDLELLIHAATGESRSIEVVYNIKHLFPGWTKINHWQLSPRAMAEPSINWLIQLLSAGEHDAAIRADIDAKIRLVKRQIKLVKDAQKSKPL